MTKLPSPNVLQEISSKLYALEQKYDIRIVFAAEAGSRAWGFPSLDSDYDVRFLYVHRPEKYISWCVDPVPEIPEILDVADDLYDIKGWSLSKAFTLMRAGNAAPFEWIQSPIRYIPMPRGNISACHEIDVACFHDFTRGVLLDAVVYSPVQLVSMLRHYESMAKRILLENLTTNGIPREMVSLKKLLYSLRAVLAASYINTQQCVPPMAISVLSGVHPRWNKTMQSWLENTLAFKEAAAPEDTHVRAPKAVGMVMGLFQCLSDTRNNMGLINANKKVVRAQYEYSNMFNEILKRAWR